MMTDNLETAYLAAGCFWCVEAVFQNLNGVSSVTSGFMGGHTQNPTYKEVCTGTTGHAEVCKIVFDQTIITFKEILQAFFYAHDPTQLNRQGHDIGTQYRSEIFYTSDTQKEISLAIIEQLNTLKIYPNIIVTQISPATVFYKAEDYHDNYFNLHPEQGYCAMVIKPKVEKFNKAFEGKLKKAPQA